jgi:hypothetical protein
VPTGAPGSPIATRSSAIALPSASSRIVSFYAFRRYDPSLFHLFVYRDGRRRKDWIVEATAGHADLAGKALPPDRCVATRPKISRELQPGLSGADEWFGGPFNMDVFDWEPSTDLKQRASPSLAQAAAAHDHGIGLPFANDCRPPPIASRDQAGGRSLPEDSPTPTRQWLASALRKPLRPPSGKQVRLILDNYAAH